jgi:hypothetical protein
MIMVTDTGAQQAFNILYFCHACGHRLRADEVRAALARDESHNTVACSSCARQGRCIRRPLAYEDRVFQSHREMVHRSAPDLSETAPIAPAPHPVLGLPVATASDRRRTQTRGTAAKRACTGELDSRRARNDAGAAVRASRSPSKNTFPAPLQKRVAGQQQPFSQRTARHPTSSWILAGIGLTAFLAVLACVLPTPGSRSRSLRAPQVNKASTSSGPAMPTPASSVSLAATVAPSAAMDRPRTPRSVPAQALKVAKTRSVPDTPNAETDWAPPGMPLNPKSKESEVAAARAAELARLRESFEQSLPVAHQLGVFKGRLAFGPDARSGVQLMEGTESLRKPDGKAPYFDGGRTIVLQKSTFDTIGPGHVVLQYSAARDFDIVLRIYGEHDVSSTLHLPAGPLQTKAIAVSNKRASKDGLKMGYRGSWEGKGYSKIRIEFKNVKPGTLALFRIGY